MPGKIRLNGLLFVVIVAPVIVIRVALLLGQKIQISSADMAGFASDLLVAALLYSCAVSLARISRLAATVLTVAWFLLNYGNYEHVSTLGSSADVGQIEYLFDRTFFFGSAVSLFSPWLLLALTGTSLLVMMLVFHPGYAAMRVWPIALPATIGLVFLSPINPSGNVLGWRQANLVHENVLQLFQPGYAGITGSLSEQDRAHFNSLYSRDLQGRPLISFAQGKENVLLVILEGISGVHLESLAKVHGIDNRIKLTALNDIARSNLAFSTLIAHNRQTNRGEYAILCGDLPLLTKGEPKMTRALRGQDPECLPDILREVGYETVYLQAAPMGFMGKDTFMPLAGFNEALGEQWFKSSHARNQWGIDDRAFLLQSAQKIEQLRKAGRPWFLTLLTVGTHHPYIIPKEYGSQDFPTAAHYLDSAFSEFLDKIREMGVLEDSLVIITSDESVGITGYRGHAGFNTGERLDDVTEKLADNWGFLIALTPRNGQGRVDDPVAQLDIAVSILDYLGLAQESGNFIGRSLFRKYDSPRPMVFGNVYKKYLGAFSGDDKLRLCSSDLSAACEVFTVSSGAPFSPERKSLGSDPEAADFLRAVVAASQVRDSPYRSFPLLRQTLVPVMHKQGEQVVFGGQYISTGPHTKISVQIDVVLEGPPGKARLGILLQSEQGKFFSQSIPALNTGDRLTLAFDYYSAVATRELAAIGTVLSISGSGLQLRFDTAKLSTTTVQPGQRPFASGLSIRRLDLNRAGHSP